jgi:hypothetical protein
VFDERHPQSKPPLNYTGENFEVIGDPLRGGGELHYENGICTGISCDSSHSKSADFSKITLGKEIAWFHLSRKTEVMDTLDDDQENRSRALARSLSSRFAEELLEGRLEKLLGSISRALDEARRSATKVRVMPARGCADALFMVARGVESPIQVTVSAVLDYLKANDLLCRQSGITASMLTAREVRKWLASIGFDWIPGGRSKGRPSRNK